MRRLGEITSARDTAATMVELTGVFESIASTRIAAVRDEVLRSGQFFDDLWRIYSQIRVDMSFNFGRSQAQTSVISKELMILITSEGSFSGDIDQRLIAQALSHFAAPKNDIIVVGYHGIAQLAQRGIQAKLNFKLPTSEKDINVAPIIAEVQKYSSTVVYYQSYVSLMQQDVKTIALGTAISQRGASVRPGEEFISEQNYIFEPSTRAVVQHLESAMTGIALSEVILESKLAQYASRFRAMRAAYEKADQTHKDLTWLYARAKRQIKDERLKEIMNGLRQGDRS